MPNDGYASRLRLFFSAVPAASGFTLHRAVAASSLSLPSSSHQRLHPCQSPPSISHLRTVSRRHIPGFNTFWAAAFLSETGRLILPTYLPTRPLPSSSHQRLHRNQSESPPSVSHLRTVSCRHLGCLQRCLQ